MALFWLAHLLGLTQSMACRRDNRNDAVCKVGLDLYKRCCRDHAEEDSEIVARLVHS